MYIIFRKVTIAHLTPQPKGLLIRSFYHSKLSIIMKQYAKIEKAEIYALKIPFKMDFTHAMALRAFSDSLILKIEGYGKKGFGEAIVRDYVSGEIGTEYFWLKSFWAEVDRKYSFFPGIQRAARHPSSQKQYMSMAPMIVIFFRKI
jgi:hypothetical protein